ncbi:MAG: FAD-dependent oxidoreductase [Pseudomonadota bacterium]
MSRTLIIGGGAIGLSVAYHLGLRGSKDVILLERNQLTSGTSWHAAGIVGPLRATPNMTRIAAYALALFPRLEIETGMSTGHRRTGGYWLAREAARLDELRRIADLGVTEGLKPSIIDPAVINLPGLNTSGLIGALHVPEDGNVNPVDLCMAYARAARSYGVDIREGAEVQSLLTNKGRVSGVALSDGSKIDSDQVILCTGAWSRELAATAGIALPLQSVEHMYVVTEPISNLPNPFPVLRDLDRGIYVKGDTGKLVFGGFEPNAKCWDAYGSEGDRAFLELPEDWDQFAPFMAAALELVPSLETSGIQRFMNGPESFTADTKPLVGECPEVDGIFVAAGMNSVGVMSSAGIGRVLADWVTDGYPPMDLWEVDVARVDPLAAQPTHLKARMEEAVADQFAMHWPYKQPTAGRGLRKSALHDQWAKAGAVFGLTAGWERGLWYAQNATERDLSYSVGAQNWWPITVREAKAMAAGAALLDLSPFTKLEIHGPNALSGLNWLTTSQLDIPLGRSRYTQVLNGRGGIEMDVTITRLSEDRFRLTSGAATRSRDLAYLRRHLPGGHIIDKTETHCTVGVMGQGAAMALEEICPRESWSGIPPGHHISCQIAGIDCQALRMSFVGEYGWELTAPNHGAGQIFDALITQGAQPMGHYALDGCRIEKGFKHWGHDIGPFITPLEAGLSFTIDWEKDFLGKDALLTQRQQGIARRQILMEIEGGALMLHDEPIYEAGELVGLTTSGGFGPRTERMLALGTIKVDPGETRAQTCSRSFSVRVAGQDYPARPLRRAPFDPDGWRMRG